VQIELFKILTLPTFRYSSRYHGIFVSPVYMHLHVFIYMQQRQIRRDRFVFMLGFIKPGNVSIMTSIC